MGIVIGEIHLLNEISETQKARLVKSFQKVGFDLPN